MKAHFDLYRPLERYVLRTPILPFTDLVELSPEKVKRICLNPIVSEAIYLSSPELHGEMIKYLKSGNLKESDKMMVTLSKFIYRMSSRCTPFGLFAGCSVGAFKARHAIELSEPQKHGRLTQLDMNFLSAWVQQIEKEPENRGDMIYYPNSSLYPIGDHIRYVEFRYKRGRKRHFTISIRRTKFIDLILERSKEGVKIDQLVQFLVGVDTTVSNAEALGFINSLIDNQILMSSLSACLTGDRYISKVRERIPSNKSLNEIAALLNKIDAAPIGSGLSDYKKVMASTRTFEMEYDKKHLFQIDLVVGFEENRVSRALLDGVKKALIALNKLTVFSEDENIERFKRKFQDRYEEEAVPLSIALDIETGIGYGNSLSDSDSHDISPLIDDLDLSPSAAGFQRIKWRPIDSFLHRKLIESAGDREIELTEGNLSGFESDWRDIPDSFSVMLNIFDNAENEPLIHIDHVGGPTASSLLGRFCHSDKEMADLVREIVEKEESLSDARLAEIVHLPEDRIGNIAYRPKLRKYEIPYLATSGLPLKDQIFVRDIWVSVQDGKITLRHKKEGKIIAPRMATAHNFSFNSLPIYQFLCDMQTQGLRHNLSFSWGNAARDFSFLPRLRYGHIILSLATWVGVEREIKSLTDFTSIERWRLNRKIPSKAFLIDGQTQLLIDFNCPMSLRVFLSLVKNKREIRLQEFLFDEKNALVNRKGKPFTNELILSFCKLKPSTL